MASVISMKALLEAGVHFGHQTRRWNPKMKPFIFQERNGIYIIDLQKTVLMLREVYAAVKQMARDNKVVLFVGTKKQAQDVVELLTDPARCQVMLVTIPEETPVNELIDTAFALEDRVGIKLAPVVVNGLPTNLGLDGHRSADDARDAGVTVSPPVTLA